MGFQVSSPPHGSKSQHGGKVSTFESQASRVQAYPPKIVVIKASMSYLGRRTLDPV